MTDAKKSLQCGHCGELALFKVRGESNQNGATVIESPHNDGQDIITWHVLECERCKKPTFEETKTAYSWIDRPLYSGMEPVSFETTILYPSSNDTTSIPNPTPDMPLEIIIDYDEARAVFKHSARASAALLRLAIQKLCKHLGQPGKNINEDIAALVKTGLSVKIQQALDIVRVIGNNAVHPGELDLQDNQETVLSLFKLINFIIEEMITRPKEIEEIYNKLPEKDRKNIENRDRTK